MWILYLTEFLLLSCYTVGGWGYLLEKLLIGDSCYGCRLLGVVADISNWRMVPNVDERWNEKDDVLRASNKTFSTNVFNRSWSLATRFRRVLIRVLPIQSKAWNEFGKNEATWLPAMTTSVSIRSGSSAERVHLILIRFRPVLQPNKMTSGFDGWSSVPDSRSSDPVPSTKCFHPILIRVHPIRTSSLLFKTDVFLIRFRRILVLHSNVSIRSCFVFDVPASGSFVT